MEYPDIIHQFYSKREKDCPDLDIINEFKSVLPKDFLDFHRKFDVSKWIPLKEGYRLSIRETPYLWSPDMFGLEKFKWISNRYKNRFGDPKTGFKNIQKHEIVEPDSYFGFNNKLLGIGEPHSGICMGLAEWNFGQIFLYSYYFYNIKVANSFSDLLSKICIIHDSYYDI